MTELNLKAIELLFTDSHGVYIPFAFINGYDLSLWSNIDDEDVRDIREGVEAEHYWDAWQNLLDNAELVNNGNVWKLYQDGDLWAVCDELMTDQEYEDFYGEVRDE